MIFVASQLFFRKNLTYLIFQILTVNIRKTIIFKNCCLYLIFVNIIMPNSSWLEEKKNRNYGYFNQSIVNV